LENLQVLIIDDDRETAGFFQAVMGLIGLSCEIVLSAKEALIRLSSGSIPDLILLDMRLGSDIGGEEILFQLRSNPRFDKTRVVVITAYPSTTDMVSNLADLVLIKPVEVEQLRMLVTRVGGAELETKQLPFRDPITLLFNKEFFDTRLELAFERARRRPDFLFATTVTEVHVEGFQDEQVSSEAWIRIMQETAERLRRHVRPTDTISRFSGHQFGALHEEIKKPEDVQVILQRLTDMLAEPIQTSEGTFKVYACCGVAVSGPTYRNPREILAAAAKMLAAEIYKGIH
jgi:diguanylate cyclase (GGDEF)-like protein